MRVGVHCQNILRVYWFVINKNQQWTPIHCFCFAQNVHIAHFLGYVLLIAALISKKLTVNGHLQLKYFKSTFNIFFYKEQQ